MRHSSKHVPGEVHSGKPTHISVAGYIGLVIAGIVLTLVVILPVTRVIILPVAEFAGQIVESLHWRSLLVPLGGLAYYIYSRRYLSKKWWTATRLVIGLTFSALLLWLYFDVLPQLAPGSERAVLAILVLLTTPVVQRFYGNQETGDLLDRIDRLSSKIRLNLAGVGDYNDRGFDYLQLGENQKAVLDFNRAIELDPQHAPAYNNRGLAYYYLGQTGEALADLYRALKLKADYADAYNNRGLVYGSQQRSDEAISDFTRALEIDPTLAVAYHNRGLDYYKMGEFEKSLADLQTSKRLAGNYMTSEAWSLATQLEKGNRPRRG